MLAWNLRILKSLIINHIRDDGDAYDGLPVRQYVLFLERC